MTSSIRHTKKKKSNIVTFFMAIMLITFEKRKYESGFILDKGGTQFHFCQSTCL